MSAEIEIVGARTNNLQSIDINLPLRQATMIVGVSGSGKSSLLADTLAAEANQRMKRFLGVHQPHLDEEDVPAFIGVLPPCLHFSQGAFRASRRTTVATSSGLLTLLRLYFRRYSKPWAEEVKDFVPPPSPVSYEKWIENYYHDSLSVWTVVERWERTSGIRAAHLLRDHGISRMTVRSETDRGAYKQNGREIFLDHFRPLAENVKHLIEAEIGQVDLRQRDSRAKLKSLLQKAFDIGRDVIVEFRQGKSLPEELHSERGVLLDSTLHWVHPKVRLPFAPPSDSLLSFNSPSNPRSGACPACHGLGRIRTVSIGALISDPNLSLHKGALSLWTKKNYRYVNIQHETVEGLRGLNDFSPDTPWKNLSESAKRLILFGSGEELVTDIDLNTGRKLSSPRQFPGFIPSILRRAEGKGTSAGALESLTIEGLCPECTGTRWSRAARALRLGAWSLPELLKLTFDELRIISAPKGQLEKELPEESRALASSLYNAAESFIAAGLGHLSGERGMTTLSEGESRRSRLAALLRAGGQGLGLLLDEPARGLHEEDVTRLVGALAELKNRHTLVINEHRLSLARAADHVIEVGPGAGVHGGRIINSGKPQQVFTSDWYPQIERSQVPITPHDSWLTVKGAQIHTLSNLTCRIPLGKLVSITGVSGSGKSSFVRGILLPALIEALPGRVESEEFTWSEGVWRQITGAEKVKSVLALEPSAPGTQRRSTVATLLGLAEDLRRLFSKTEQAHKAKLTVTDFGWNAGRGRCQTCLGLGEIEDGAWIRCPHCGGSRFGEEVLGIRVEGLNVAEILNLSIADLIDHPFTSLADWRPLLEQLLALDLGYLALGRRVDRLSGGEHQRLRIAKTLTGKQPEGLMLILDEPSAGLHPRDVVRLLKVLDQVVAGGLNTVVLVEHNLDLIRASDWIIDFGPGSGPAGGNIVGEGTSSQIAQCDTPTGRALNNKRFSLTPYRDKNRKPNKTGDRVRSESAAKSGRQWLKRLMGEETSADDIDPVDFEGLAIMFDPNSPVRPYEIAGLDVEIARLLLDEVDDGNKQAEQLARLWSERPQAQLQIHPLIEELRIWGKSLPASALHAARQRLQYLGIESNFTIFEQGEVASVRVTGKRFQPVTDSLDERIRCVRDALGIGGGYVELFEKSSGVISSARTRRLDLEVPAVAPASPSSACLVRSHTMGRCPCCSGKGTVSVIDESLIIANPMDAPTKESFFHPEALKVIRGVRRSIMLPFFKRMATENLWPEDCSFAQLEPEKRTILMHGYWHRPGYGSFLKNSHSDPEEVNSWLRWNGLFRIVLDEAERSKSNEWLRQVRVTTRGIECPICLGTGLQMHARAVYLGQKSFFDLVRTGTIGELTKSLNKIVPASERSERTRKRILHCIEPLSLAVPLDSLREKVTDTKLLRAVYERTVHKMTTLEVVK
jgi:excinuclease ABC A subunit